MERSENFRDLSVVLDELQGHCVSLDRLIKTKVLVRQRGEMFQRVKAVNTMAEQMRELLKRSGMLNRLGFVTEGGTVQPVMLQAPESTVNDSDATTTEGSGVPGG